MRTIEKISRYQEYEIREGLEKGYINGCGGKGGVNFSKMVKEIFRNFENFDIGKIEVLWFDIERLCAEHDLDYQSKNGFYLSNFIFAKGVKNLVKSWTSFGERLILFLVIFFGLNKYGKKYYTSPQPSPLGEGETPSPFMFPPQGGGKQIMHHLYKRKITAVYEKITAVMYKIKGVFIK